MGPMALFDKSFLQSLTVDESVWFDCFFLPNICPLFYVEALADLKKRNLKGRSPEQEVQIIARKFPQMNGTPCAFHSELCVDSLLGYNVPNTGQIPMDDPGQRLVVHEGKLHVIAEETATAAAFSRWQAGKFLDVERFFAEEWRRALSGVDLKRISDLYKSFGFNPRSCSSLEHVKSMVQTLLSATAAPDLRLAFTFDVLSIPIQAQSKIVARWQTKRAPSLQEFAPYASFVLSIELFFNIALAANLIATDRPSHRVDIAYLFYLPFCMIFVSSDRLHRTTAPLFLREHQEFVWGGDLKSALGEINRHFARFPDSEKEKGINALGKAPPAEVGHLVEQLWDHHIPRWREIEVAGAKTKPFEEIVKTTREIERATPIQADPSLFLYPEAESFTMKRVVNKRRGSWYQIPKERH